ncbi:LysR family transcriptional regulator [Saccharothrix sp. NRRL B-16348]|uniref:LysR family transcriptional regulator n=1 Tax=Saccharothrix sp. NRRL B-16348 TaxID=1415542 RepID=UPI0006B025A0|nr:LysR family transcriptional regulator [Saccharothrix sp. NRRL B-16348]
MEFRQLEAFLAVVDEGGFGRAAQRLHIVQSAVSQQVKRLERELGVTLFDRTGRQARLSAAGERLLPEARAVLAAVRRTREVAARVASGAEGVVRFGTLNGPGDRLYRALARLDASGLRVRLDQSTPARRLAAVRDGRLDAALVRAATDAPGLAVVPVWTDPLYVALPTALADDERPGLADFADLPLRLAPREDNPPFHDLITGALRAVDRLPPAGPPFTTLQRTLADIASGPPSWTVVYRVTDLPPAPGITFRRLADPVLTTSLVLPAAPSPVSRRLVAAFAG